METGFLAPERHEDVAGSALPRTSHFIKLKKIVKYWQEMPNPYW
ncbi:unnamed protein product, partial [Vitis vinifera]|uniref:Uncharacterized protein n=1 Tax=Vitis vinifera TaxID=29760 RepID=D7TB58_VITVI